MDKLQKFIDKIDKMKPDKTVKVSTNDLIRLRKHLITVYKIKDYLKNEITKGIK